MNVRLFDKQSLLLLLLLCTLLLLTDAAPTKSTRTTKRPAKPNARPHTIYYRYDSPNKLGHYNFEFQTSNGITTKGAGNEHGAVGVVQYVSLEGLPVTFTYVADANGYQPSGDYMPKHLQRQLEYIRTHPTVNEPKSRHW
ncbi:Cpr78Ca [Drosophila busckii]|uniref:Cpr78Ca n=1 Tax=Drosophila busckii TaxID=30019 RepID=A0A0M4EEI2_DROBS|nr:pupal cuticle protein Edg-78E [Drosophila busckii]ALC44196.1 Cpr78Ca [Drosophila busckii]